MSYNRIRKIECVDHNPHLEKLFLASNMISKIENLDNLPNLKMLELGFNKIEVRGGLYFNINLHLRSWKD